MTEGEQKIIRKAHIYRQADKDSKTPGTPEEVAKRRRTRFFAERDLFEAVDLCDKKRMKGES